MGLDMYVFILKGTPAAEVDFPETAAIAQLHYWRKHPNLHGWMQALYRKKGGRDPDFNFAPVVLKSADLDQLKADIQRGRLPATSGFFFGHSTGEEKPDDLAFIEKARAAVAAGLTVFYVADW